MEIKPKKKLKIISLKFYWQKKSVFAIALTIDKGAYHIVYIVQYLTSYLVQYY